MKKILLFAAIILYSYAVHAQTSQEIVDNFKALLEEAKIDFKNVKGDIIEKREKNIYYESRKTLGASTEAIGVDFNDHDFTYFFSKFDYSESGQLQKAKELLPNVYAVVEAMLQSKKYNRKIYFDKDGVNGMEVKDFKGSSILKIDIVSKSPDGNNYCLIIINGKN